MWFGHHLTIIDNDGMIILLSHRHPVIMMLIYDFPCCIETDLTDVFAKLAIKYIGQICMLS